MAKKPDRQTALIRLQDADRKHIKATDGYARKVNKIYDEAAREYARLAGSLFAPDPNKPFSFDDYPTTKKKAAALAQELTANVKKVIEAGQRSEWLAATYRADAFLGTVLDRSKLTADEIKQYEDRNLEGLAAFQGRKVQGMDLSARVWKYTDQFTSQMEMAIDIALGEGRSAQELSRDVRSLLNEPNKLFRRVRDKYGNLQLSKAAAAYHPGRGVYRSSAQNAMRLARTEINMAYRQADWQRWQTLDFVVGIRISLSNNHTIKNRKGELEPLEDICNELAGDYPKTFKFVGWHPNCRCVITPILQSDDEMHSARRARLRAVMNEEAYKAMPSANQVNTVPDAFTRHIEAIAKRSEGWASQPYYIRDNFNGGRIAGGLSSAVPHTQPVGGTAAKPNTPPTPCTLYDTEIDELKKKAYALGLDISRLDPLRAAGESAPLKAEVTRLKTTAEDRTADWLAAAASLRAFLTKCKGKGYKSKFGKIYWDAFSSKFEGIISANSYDLNRYYGDAIKALTEGLKDAQTTWTNLKDTIAREEAATPKDYPDTMPDELHDGGSYLANYGDNYKFNKDFFKLLKTQPTLVITKNNSKGSYETARGMKVVINVSSRGKDSQWEHRSVIYHEFGHAIADQQGLLHDAEVTKTRDAQLARLRKKTKGFYYKRTIEGHYDAETDTYKTTTKKEKVEVNQMYIITLSQKIQNIVNRLRNKKEDDPIFKRYGLTKGDALEQICCVMDTLRSLVNRQDVGYGHSVSYFKYPGMKEHEYLAHCFENAYIGNTAFKVLMPTEYAEMIALVKTFKQP